MTVEGVASGEKSRPRRFYEEALSQAEQADLPEALDSGASVTFTETVDGNGKLRPSGSMAAGPRSITQL